MSNKKLVEEYLAELGIDYTLVSHEPLYTMEDTKKICVAGMEPKNLVVKDKKDERIYLIILDGETRFEIKRFRNITGASSKVSFVKDDELYRIMRISPGGCSPFGVLNDSLGTVTIVMFKEVAELNDEAIINFHPNVNTETVILNMKNFRKFLKSIKNKVIEEKDTDD